MLILKLAFTIFHLQKFNYNILLIINCQLLIVHYQLL